MVTWKHWVLQLLREEMTPWLWLLTVHREHRIHRGKDPSLGAQLILDHRTWIEVLTESFYGIQLCSLVTIQSNLKCLIKYSLDSGLTPFILENSLRLWRDWTENRLYILPYFYMKLLIQVQLLNFVIHWQNVKILYSTFLPKQQLNIRVSLFYAVNMRIYISFVLKSSE